MKSKRPTVSEWINSSAMSGKLFFSLDDIIEAFPSVSRSTLMTSIGRQISRGSVQSLWRGFYGILVYEYGFRRIIPVVDYIDLLMQYLQRDYYVTLLSAAALQGAAHQSPQTFMVMVKGGSLRMKEKNGVRIKFYTRLTMPTNYIERVLTKTGYMTVSTPELTALDIVARMKEIGGLSRAVEILEELAEGMDFSRVGADYFSLAPLAAIQRLGYLLDEVLGYAQLSEELFMKATQSGLHFRSSFLVSGKTGHSQFSDNSRGRWKITPNKKIEVSQ
jgi:predicted transcriptional regulator of viral defense system